MFAEEQTHSTTEKVAYIFGVSKTSKVKAVAKKLQFLVADGNIVMSAAKRPIDVISILSSWIVRSLGGENIPLFY